MTFLIDLDEGTAARRRVPIKLFTSDGTSPDTGASGDSLMYSVNGGSESDLTVVTITAADGMYYGEFAAADVGTLGTIALWHRDGAFAQHVANVNVVNSNPMSSQSNIPLVATVTDLTNAVVLTAAGRNLVAVDSADSVWDEDATGHQTGGTFGQAIGDPVADATTIYQAVVTDATGDNVAVDVVAVKAETVLIVADTNELQTDNVPGLIAALNDIDGSNVTLNSEAEVSVVSVVWDRVLTGATHNVNTSAGRRLRQIEAAFNVHAGTAQGGTVSSITLDTGASTTNDIYNGDRVVIVGGTGAQEHALISDYTGSTREATIHPDWVVTPDATSEFELIPASVDVELFDKSAAAVINLVAAFDGTGYDSGLTVFVKDSIATIAGVTNIATDIAALNDIDGSEVTVHSGGIASTAFAAGAIDAASLSADAGAELADAHLDRDMSTGVDSGTSAIRTPRDALRALRNRVDLSGNTLTVFDEDDVTAAWTASLTTTGDSNFPTAMDPNG